MHRIVIGIGILATWLTGAASASAQGCDPLKPAWPVDKEIRNVTEANVNILLRSLGSGDIRNEYHRIERTQKFNNPDDVHRWNSFIYMLCTLLERSSLSDDEKIEYYFTLVRMSQQGPLEPTREGDALRTPLSNPTPAVIFQDTFETDIRPEWVMDGDNFNVVNGRLSSLGGFSAYVGDKRWDNYAVEFDLVDFAYSSDLRVLVRRQRNADYMSLHLGRHFGGCKSRWIIVAEGEEQELANSEMKLTNKCIGHYRIEVDGNTYSFSKDRIEIASIANKKFSSGGVGMLSMSNDTEFVFDNFKVEALRR